MDQLLTIVLTAVITCIVGRLLNGFFDKVHRGKK